MSVINLLLGRPLTSDEKEGEKIGLLAGVPAMGLDGLTSAAYGPEAALAVLASLGVAGLHAIIPITLVILGLLGMLYFSYRQTIVAYPSNGGSYIVARENLGRGAGLLAAAALMIDYVLNVAVGISAGVAALVSAAPTLQRFTVVLCLGILVLITLLNLRGTGEAGIVFSIPTYAFIGCLSIVLLVGIFRVISSGGHPHPVVSPPTFAPATQAVGIWIMLRSFASGCTAMTGVEAVSNGVSAFREPRVRNALRTLTFIVLVLGLFLGGIAFLCRAYRIGAMPQDQPGYQSVLSQLTGAALGRGGFYYVAIGSVLATLCLSANTSFVGFPRLCRLIAQDDYLPRAFTTMGRRLVYSVGVIFLASFAGLLLIGFKGVTDRLIPLFAIGAFLAFTLSQAGMVQHWRKQGRRPTEQAAADRSRGQSASPPRTPAALWINGIGAAATAAALVIILAAKFIEGAWITVLAIPGLLVLFRLVNRHYEKIETQVSSHAPLDLSHNERPVVLVPIRRWDKLAEKALRFSMWLSTDVIAVHLSNLSGDELKEEELRVRQQWEKDVEQPAASHGTARPTLVVVESPYRSFIEPLLARINRVRQKYPDRLIGLVLPEVVETHWYTRLLHRRKADRLRRSLREQGDPMVIIITVPWYIDK